MPEPAGSGTPPATDPPPASSFDDSGGADLLNGDLAALPLGGILDLEDPTLQEPGSEEAALPDQEEAGTELDEPGGPGAVLVPEVVETAPRGRPTGERALVRVDPLARYLAEIRRYPALDRDEEQRLARAFRERGDKEAATRLITANLILVVRIARQFRHAVSSALDLIQEGNVGLLMALERFDPDVGVRFSTYAGWWIKAYILKYLLDNVRMVRVGTTNARRKLLYNLQREKRRLEADGFAPGPKLLAERFGATEKDVVDIEQTLSGRDVSLDAPVADGAESTRGDTMPAPGPSVEDEVARRELKEMLDAKLARFREGLAGRDAALLDLRILAEDPATLQEIGDRFGITREAVRQAEKRLTERLKAFLSAELGDRAVLQIRSLT